MAKPLDPNSNPTQEPDPRETKEESTTMMDYEVGEDEGSAQEPPPAPRPPES